MKVFDCAHCKLLQRQEIGTTFHPAVPCDTCLASYDEEENERQSIDNLLSNLDFFNEEEKDASRTCH